MLTDLFNVQVEERIIAGVCDRLGTYQQELQQPMPDPSQLYRRYEMP